MNRIAGFDCDPKELFRGGMRCPLFALMLAGTIQAVFLGGCASATNEQMLAAGAPPEGAGVILEGDQLKISFVGAPSMDSTQEVRRDGRITLRPPGV